MSKKLDDSVSTKIVVEEPAPKVYNSTSVKLQSMRDAHVLYTGQETGKSYEWIRAGSIQVVDALDAPILLGKRIKTQSCCSGSDMPIFQTVD
jgi:hypothetical protein